MEDSDQSKLVRINFEPIQKPLMDLAETVAQKVRREGPALLNAPPYVAPNMFVMLRHAMHIYDFLFYIHADERRQNDCYWKSAYTFVSAPLIRSLIDYLYNLTLILQDPSVNGAAYCKSGFRNELRDLDEDEARYGGNPNWEGYLKEKRGKIHLELRKYGLTFPEIQSQTPWPTMGKYIADKQPVTCPRVLIHS